MFVDKMPEIRFVTRCLWCNASLFFVALSLFIFISLDCQSIQTDRSMSSFLISESLNIWYRPLHRWILFSSTSNIRKYSCRWSVCLWWASSCRANPTEPNKILHICSQCTRTFKDINNFREHLFQEHGELGVNVRQCHLCSYATLLKSKYDCHIVSCSTGLAVHSSFVCLEMSSQQPSYSMSEMQLFND